MPAESGDFHILENSHFTFHFADKVRDKVKGLFFRVCTFCSSSILLLLFTDLNLINNENSDNKRLLWPSYQNN